MAEISDLLTRAVGATVTLETQFASCRATENVIPDFKCSSKIIIHTSFLFLLF